MKLKERSLKRNSIETGCEMFVEHLHANGVDNALLLFVNASKRKQIELH